MAYTGTTLSVVISIKILCFLIQWTLREGQQLGQLLDAVTVGYVCYVMTAVLWKKHHHKSQFQTHKINTGTIMSL